MKTLIIGGSGTLGSALLDRLEGQVTCFSRGELAQKQLHTKHPDVNMVIGDVRDRPALDHAMVGVDTVFLLAAIKHIDIAEKNPLEAIKTNVLGAVNVGKSALAHGVKHVVYCNTDKAVLPISTYGYTKALAQNYLLSLNGKGKTKFSAFVWGNIVASRGSVIQTFVEKLMAGDVIPITDTRMSRFWLTIDQAADFMLREYVTAPTDRAMIPPVKAATVVRVVDSIARLLQVEKFSMGFTGLRGVEKLYEVLESTHEGCLRSDTCEQYEDAELDQLLRETVRRLSAEATVDRRKSRGHGTPVQLDTEVPRRLVPRRGPRREVAGA